MTTRSRFLTSSAGKVEHSLISTVDENIIPGVYYHRLTSLAEYSCDLVEHGLDEVGDYLHPEYIDVEVVAEFNRRPYTGSSHAMRSGSASSASVGGRRRLAPIYCELPERGVPAVGCRDDLSLSVGGGVDIL